MRRIKKYKVEYIMICLVDVLGGHVVGVGAGGAGPPPVATSLHDSALNLVR